MEPMYCVVSLFTLAVVDTHSAYPLRYGWAELIWVAGYIPRSFTCPQMVTHPDTNQAQCRVTTLIETKILPLGCTAK